MQHTERARDSERRLRACVVLNVPGSSSALTIHFLSVHFSLYCISSLPYSVCSVC